MVLATIDGQILAANPAMCRMYGRTEAELIELGRSAEIAVMDDALWELVERRRRDGFARGHVTLRHSSGRTFKAEMSAVTFDTPEGPQVHVMLVDISEQLRTHRALEILAKAGR